MRKCEDEEQANLNGFCEVDCVRLNVRANSPHSAGCRTTPGNGAIAFVSTREMGEMGDGGVMAESAEPAEPADPLESKLPVDEQDAPREETGLSELLESLFWQL